MLSSVARHFMRQSANISPMAKAAEKTAAMLGRKQAQPGRMFAHQQSLSRLPVPPLQQTLYKYLLAVQPILSEEDYEATKKIVTEFGKPGGYGESLQMALIQRYQKMDNWLAEWWLHKAYLEFRSPVVLHVSPGVVFPREDFRGVDAQLEFSARFIAGVLDFKQLIDSNSLPDDYMGGQPLCMYRYHKILSSCRVPGVKKDSVVSFPPNEPDAPRHTVIGHNNHLFSLVVYDSQGKPLPISEIHSKLKEIVAASPFPAEPVNILTSEHRNTWGKIFKKMSKDKVNRASFEEIKRSIFMVCLDKSVYSELDGQMQVESFANYCAKMALYGGGSRANSCNRWFDKTIQFMIGADGEIALQYEHCTVEGPYIMAMIDHSLHYAHNTPVESSRSSAISTSVPKRLDFNLDCETLEAIEDAKCHIDSLGNDVQISCFSFEPFGKDFCKSQKLSPDAFIQLSIQLAFFKLYGHSTATYETASLRKFQFARTDTIRSATVDSDIFVRAMCESTKKLSEKAHLLRKAILAHREYTNAAINGDAIDRHLFGLKLIAIEQGKNVPEIFMDTSYTAAMHFRLSTSQVPAKHDLTMIFGPVVPNGYGVCYNPQDDHINFGVTAFNTVPETDSEKFSQKLAESLLDMQRVLNKVPPHAKL
ncbi:carnitine O-acetyltransferase-like [Patiria miniata]|uniref:Choline/carnitine acyltransferase domain-containing protein n=1 Tax=Patiria miniata TaxID=46514 RepID=A0A913Z270_PATMI|nr:carnitine O-acetyltransferase-like [Patiria miniata]